MRKLLLSLLVLGPLCASPVAAHAGAPAGSDWSRVQNLPAGSKIHVKADHGSSTCRVEKVDEDTLNCTGGMGGKHSFPRGEVRSVKVTRYVESTVAGTAIGAGGGFLFGVVLPNNKGSLFTRGQVGAIFLVPGAAVGAIVGGSTDFCEGTIYRRP